MYSIKQALTPANKTYVLYNILLMFPFVQTLWKLFFCFIQTLCHLANIMGMLFWILVGLQFISNIYFKWAKYK